MSQDQLLIDAEDISLTGRRGNHHSPHVANFIAGHTRQAVREQAPGSRFSGRQGSAAETQQANNRVFQFLVFFAKDIGSQTINDRLARLIDFFAKICSDAIGFVTLSF